MTLEHLLKLLTVLFSPITGLFGVPEMKNRGSMAATLDSDPGMHQPDYQIRILGAPSSEGLIKPIDLEEIVSVHGHAEGSQGFPVPRPSSAPSAIG